MSRRSCSTWSTILSFVLMAVFIGGCAASRKPIFLEVRFDQSTTSNVQMSLLHDCTHGTVGVDYRATEPSSSAEWVVDTSYVSETNPQFRSLRNCLQTSSAVASVGVYRLGS